MKIQMVRTDARKNSMLGKMSIDGEHECFTLEDEPREKKLPKETAIPAGTYQIKPRLGSPKFDAKYAEHYPGIHIGMPWLQDVPGFKFVYIHRGNYEHETEGCLLVGTGHTMKGDDHMVTASADAYKALYMKIRTAWMEDEPVEIEIVDGYD